MNFIGSKYTQKNCGNNHVYQNDPTVAIKIALVISRFDLYLKVVNVSVFVALELHVEVLTLLVLLYHLEAAAVK